MEEEKSEDTRAHDFPAFPMCVHPQPSSLAQTEGTLTSFAGAWLGGKEPDASAGGLPAPLPQSSGKGLGMAGSEDVLNCWSSSCRRLRGETTVG